MSFRIGEDAKVLVFGQQVPRVGSADREDLRVFGSGMSFDGRGDVVTSNTKSDDNVEVATLVRETAQRLFPLVRRVFVV